MPPRIPPPPPQLVAPQLKRAERLDWVDALFVWGVLLTIIAIYLLAGLAWMLLATGISCILVAARLTNRQVQRKTPEN